jgi:hypothetical protein
MALAEAQRHEVSWFFCGAHSSAVSDPPRGGLVPARDTLPRWGHRHLTVLFGFCEFFA